mgnify:CR=1 FL=1
MGYAHLFVDDTHIDHTTAAAGNVVGNYDIGVAIFSVQFNWRL